MSRQFMLCPTPVPTFVNFDSELVALRPTKPTPPSLPPVPIFEHGESSNTLPLPSRVSEVFLPPVAYVNALTLPFGAIHSPMPRLPYPGLSETNQDSETSESSADTESVTSDDSCCSVFTDNTISEVVIPRHVLGGKRGTITREQKIAAVKKGATFWVDGADPANFSHSEVLKVKDHMSVHGVSGMFNGNTFNNKDLHGPTGTGTYIGSIHDLSGEEFVILEHDEKTLQEGLDSFKDGKSCPPLSPGGLSDDDEDDTPRVHFPSTLTTQTIPKPPPHAQKPKVTEFAKPQGLRVKPELRGDGLSKTERYEKRIRNHLTEQKMTTHTEFHEAIKIGFMEMQMATRKKGLIASTHTHIHDAKARGQDEVVLNDVLSAAQNKNTSKEEAEKLRSHCTEVQASDRSRHTLDACGNVYRASFTAKDTKYGFYATDDVRGQACLVMTDVDSKFTVPQFENLLWNNPDASVMMYHVNPRDACIRPNAQSPGSETEGHFNAEGSWAQKTNPAEYPADQLNDFNKDTMTVTTQLKFRSVTKTVVQTYSVHQRQVDGHRCYVLLNPMATLNMYTVERAGVTRTVVCRRLQAQYDAHSTSPNGYDSWKIVTRQNTGLISRVKKWGSRFYFRRVSTLRKGARHVHKWMRFKRAVKTSVPGEPMGIVMIDNEATQLKKFNPVTKYTHEQHGTHTFAEWVVMSNGCRAGGTNGPLERDNVNEHYVALGYTRVGRSYRIPVEVWSQLCDLRNCTHGGWTGTGPIRKVLKENKLYCQESGAVLGPQFEALVTLIDLRFKVQSDVMTTEALTKSFHNDTCGRVVTRGDDPIRGPSINDTTNGPLTNRTFSPNACVAQAEHAVDVRQAEPQKKAATHDKAVAAEYRANALEWATLMVNENGLLVPDTYEEAIARLPSSKQQKYKDALAAYPTVDELIKKQSSNSIFLKAESNTSEKAARVITQIDDRLQLEMKIWVYAVNDLMKKQQWFAMQKPKDTASKMVEAFEGMSAGFLGDGSKFEAHFSEYNHETFMDVVKRLYGNNYDDKQRDVYLFVLKNASRFGIKTEGVAETMKAVWNWVMPSGIVWTTIINSFTNFFILLTALMRAGMSFAEAIAYINKHCRIGGDDQACSAPDLKTARKLGASLTETADLCGFKWKTDIVLPANHGLSDEEAADTVGYVEFLSRIWYPWYGCNDSAATPDKMMYKLAEKGKSNATGTDDASRATDSVNQLISHAPSDYNSYGWVTKLMDQAFKLRNLNTDAEKLAAAEVASLGDSSGAAWNLFKNNGSYPNEHRSWMADAMTERLADAKHNTALLLRVKVSETEPMVFPLLEDTELVTDKRKLKDGTVVEVLQLPDHIPTPETETEKETKRKQKGKQKENKNKKSEKPRTRRGNVKTKNNASDGVTGTRINTTKTTAPSPYLKK